MYIPCIKEDSRWENGEHVMKKNQAIPEFSPFSRNSELSLSFPAPLAESPFQAVLECTTGICAWGCTYLPHNFMIRIISCTKSPHPNLLDEYPGFLASSWFWQVLWRQVLPRWSLEPPILRGCQSPLGPYPCGAAASSLGY